MKEKIKTIIQNTKHELLSPSFDILFAWQEFFFEIEKKSSFVPFILKIIFQLFFQSLHIPKKQDKRDYYFNYGWKLFETNVLKIKNVKKVINGYLNEIIKSNKKIEIIEFYNMYQHFIFKNWYNDNIDSNNLYKNYFKKNFLILNIFSNNSIDLFHAIQNKNQNQKIDPNKVIKKIIKFSTTSIFETSNKISLIRDKILLFSNIRDFLNISNTKYNRIKKKKSINRILHLPTIDYLDNLKRFKMENYHSYEIKSIPNIFNTFKVNSTNYKKLNHHNLNNLKYINNYSVRYLNNNKNFSKLIQNLKNSFHSLYKIEFKTIQKQCYCKNCKKIIYKSLNYRNYILQLREEKQYTITNHK
ncbi:hypothetical protein M0812_18385 [Anaeramoeba flamelloides]|uniref:Uncharacterized protein n=1 Tax=Anaeramoeba flamelloides TaxID=1746091 RepID=A0AAV7Z2J8_9EUKA|nr:hypothetical protein M0812_18385 [Anaeramoeba flamelloides]